MHNDTDLNDILNMATTQFGSEFKARLMRHETNFLGGELFILEAIRDQPTRWARQCYVFKNARAKRFFASPEEFIVFIGMKRESTFRASFLTALDPVTAISGFIAILITTVILFQAVSRGEVPPLLANALATILGFYFGRSANLGASSVVFPSQTQKEE